MVHGDEARFFHHVEECDGVFILSQFASIIRVVRYFEF